jgi:hypothetical protein
LRNTIAGLIALLGLGWGPGRADDFADIRTLRSLAAEASEVCRLSAQHRVTEVYAHTMLKEARDELQDTAESTRSAPLKAIARNAIAAVNKADANMLARIAQQLFEMEGPHGRAG